MYVVESPLGNISEIKKVKLYFINYVIYMLALKPKFYHHDYI